MMATTTASSSSPTSVTIPRSEIPSQVDLLISLHLHLWPALTLAIQNAWGTSSPQISSDKRDWLAGAISDLFAQNQLRDLEDLEDVLEQVMSDEFEVVVDDGTLEEVAAKIWRGVGKVRAGDGSEIKDLMAEWEKKKNKKVVGTLQDNGEGDSTDGDDEDWEGFEDETINKNNVKSADVDMDEAPTLIEATRAKPEPEIDEDGFTKVVSKRKR